LLLVSSIDTNVAISAGAKVDCKLSRYPPIADVKVVKAAPR